MEENSEVWRPVLGYEGIYEVSILGRVRSLNYNKTGKMKYLKQSLRNGYLRVSLHKNGIQQCENVHRIVAHAFPDICGVYFEGCQINHKDECKTNNTAWNLETCTPKYNTNYGTGIKRCAEAKKKRVIQMDLNHNVIKIWDSPKDAANTIGVKPDHIYDCCNLKRNSAFGFCWSY